MPVSKKFAKKYTKDVDGAHLRMKAKAQGKKITQGMGAKYDAGKLLYRPLMRGLALPLRALAAILSYGAQKYAEDSWQEVPDAKRRYEDALYRHQQARNEGHVYDEESGLPHRAHEIINSMFVLYFEIKEGTIQNIDKFNPPPKR